MRGTLLKEKDRLAVVARLRRLSPGSTRQWGELDAPRMLCHLADQLRVAVGKLPTRRVDSLVTRTLVKWLVVDTAMPAPRGKIKTAPEMLTSAPAEWDSDLAACESLIGEVAAGTAAAVHPTFGPLGPEEWGRLCWKHLDHHLRQFGV